MDQQGGASASVAGFVSTRRQRFTCHIIILSTASAHVAWKDSTDTPPGISTTSPCASECAGRRPECDNVLSGVEPAERYHLFADLIAIHNAPPVRLSVSSSELATAGDAVIGLRNEWVAGKLHRSHVNNLSCRPLDEALCPTSRAVSVDKGPVCGSRYVPGYRSTHVAPVTSLHTCVCVCPRHSMPAQQKFNQN